MKKGTSQLKLITRSISVIGSISYIVRDRSRSLPQIILAQTKTMKVALKPKPMTVVTKLVSIPIVPTSQNQFPRPGHKPQKKLKQRRQSEEPKHDTHLTYKT